MHKLWLLFAQTATVAVAALFVVATLRPEWLPQRGPGAQVVELRQAEAPASGSSRVSSYSDAVRRAEPAVVSVVTSKEIRAPRNPSFDDPLFRHFFGDRFNSERQRASGLGSGVIVNSRGYILTNHHVVEAADEIEVVLADGKKMPAKVIGTDPESDLAVLRVEADNLPAITFGQPESVRVGDVVLAIGNPFGVGQTVTMGIVSALGRSGLQINTFENFIQTDAAINPGNSGGALTDAAGNLIGINSAIYSRTPGGASLGIGFAIPVSTAKHVMEEIIGTGSVTRGWIGVEAQEITAELAESFLLPSTSGALIAGVIRNGPASKAGIRPGDILLAIDGTTVTDPNSMLNLVAALTPGKNATMKIRRGQNDLDVRIEVGKRPPLRRQR